MKFYRIQYKAAAWFEIEATSKKAMEEFKKHIMDGVNPDYAFAEVEEKYPNDLSYNGVMEETEEHLLTDHNEGEATLEIYEESGNELTQVWTNKHPDAEE